MSARQWYWVAGVLTVLGWMAATGLAAETPLRADRDNTTIKVTAGDRPVLVYRHGDVAHKPYVVELYSPGGTQVLRDSPLDHKHHHALMFAIGADGVDFWSEHAKCGRQKIRSQGAVKSENRNGTARVSFSQRLDWIGPGSEQPLMLEQRQIEVAPSSEAMRATVATWRSRLEVPPGKQTVKLTGSHYFGLGMRFVTSMDKAGQFFNSEGKLGDIVRGSERLSRAKWCAYTAAADGKPVTVAVFDHSQNVRHPAAMFTMDAPFAYLSATMNLWKEPMTLSADKPLSLCYGVAVWDGPVESAAVEQLYHQWVKRVENSK